MSEPYGPDETISKLDKIKMFAQLMVRSLSEQDFLSVVTFGTNSEVVFPLTRMSEDEKVISSWSSVCTFHDLLSLPH